MGCGDSKKIGTSPSSYIQVPPGQYLSFNGCIPAIFVPYAYSDKIHATKIVSRGSS